VSHAEQRKGLVVTQSSLNGEPRSLPDLVPGGMCVAMVMTMIGRSHSSRPVTVADVRDTRLSFLVSRDADWVSAIAGQAAIVHVTIADEGEARYVALNGLAKIVVDEAESQRLWSPIARAWFTGPDDPDLAVLHFDVSDGQYWDGPGSRIGRAVAMARAALTGDGDELGTHGEVLASE
jgi:general stress protein 26